MRFLNLVFCLLFGLFFSARVLAADFVLTSLNFTDSGALPNLYTCDGKNISPELRWANPPVATQSFALLVTDVDAPTGPFYHWLVYNIPTTTSELSAGVKMFPLGTLVGKNTWNNTEYAGPCPPKESSHTYIFTLYALDTKLNLLPGADVKTFLEKIKSHVLQKAELSAEFGH